MIKIAGVNKAFVLAALYNASRVQGMGVIQAAFRDSKGLPYIMPVKEAEELLKEHTYFDYLYGRVMKVDLSSDEEFDERLYDRDNGPEAARDALESLGLIVD